MKVFELIDRLKDFDPGADVQIYVCRPYGGYQRVPTTVREFIPGSGEVFISDERDEA